MSVKQENKPNNVVLPFVCTFRPATTKFCFTLAKAKSSR